MKPQVWIAAMFLAGVMMALGCGSAEETGPAAAGEREAERAVGDSADAERPALRETVEARVDSVDAWAEQAAAAPPADAPRDVATVDGEVRGAWQQVALDGKAVLSVAVDPARATVWAGTEAGDVYRSDAQGARWTAMGRPAAKVNDVFVDADGQVWAAAMGDWVVRAEGANRPTVRPTGGGVFRFDGDGAWTYAGLKDQSVRRIQQLSDGALVVGARNDVFRRRGAEWEPMGLELRVASDLAVAPGTGTLYAALIDGVARRAAGDAGWTATGLDGVKVDVRALLIDPRGDLYAGLIGGVFRSTDDGATWAKLNRGLGNVNVLTLARDARGILYAGTQDGVYRSTDGGASWSADGLDGLAVRRLAAAPDGTLFAATPAGVYRHVGPVTASR